MNPIKQLAQSLLVLAAPAALAFLFVSAVACGSEPTIPKDALSIMEIAFQGNPPKEQIRERLDLALRLYNTPITEENYSRAASTLVALRKETSVEEMRILDYMIRSNVPGVNISFPEAAGLAAAFLKLGID